VHPDLDYNALIYEKDGNKFVSGVAEGRIEAVVAAAS